MVTKWCARGLWALMLVAGVACSSEEGQEQSGLSTGGFGGAGGVSGAGAGGVSGLGSGGTAGTMVVGGMSGGTGGAAGTVAGTGGMSGGTGGAAGMVAGMGGMTGGGGGMSGMTGGGGGMSGMTGGDGGMAGMMTTGGTGGGMMDGSCCDDGDCICREGPPSEITNEEGRYTVDSYSLAGTGCIYYPTDAEPPFAAVAVSDGFLGSGGCGALAQTSGWGPLLASHGIVTMIIETLGGDQPPTRGAKLSQGIEGFKAENENSSSPLFGKLAGRYGTAGFSMGGGGTSYAAVDDPTLKSSMPIMPWGPNGSGTQVPTLIICGSSDGIASCSAHGTPLYGQIPDSTPKIRVTVSGGHNGQPSAGGGLSGAYGIAFQKVFLEGDERWRDILVAAENNDSNL